MESSTFSRGVEGRLRLRLVFRKGILSRDWRSSV
jgi:hypothetical protein